MVFFSIFVSNYTTYYLLKSQSMKKPIFLSIVALFMSCGFSMSQDLTLDEILQNYYKVTGTEKFADIKSITAVGKIITQGMELSFVQMMKRPGKVRTEVDIQGSKMIQVYDGKTGWMIAPWLGTDEPQDMSEDQIGQLKEQADFEGKLWNWKDKVVSLELIGKEDMEGTEVYKLKMIEKDENLSDDNPIGNTRFVYIDAESFVILKLNLKQKIQGIDMEIDVFQSNYKDVEGVIMPFGMKTVINGKTSDEVTIDSYKFNAEIDDALFEKPVKK
jgi:outer membrane lipoprotein-sorting protein